MFMASPAPTGAGSKGPQRWRVRSRGATVSAMAGDSEYEPPTRDEDAVTYLPIDKQKESRVPFGPTDLRGSSATGGMRVGQKFPFIPDSKMPSLDAEHVGKACDHIVRGHDTWASLLYLSRAQPGDVGLLLEASQSYEIKVRWERLWVLSPFFSRLARRDDARPTLTKAFAEDVAGLHLLSKFAEQNNPSVKKLFARLKPTLLPALLGRLCDHASEPRRAALLCSIIAAMETSEAALQAAFGKSVTSHQKEAAMNMLYHVEPKDKAKTLSSSTLRERLEQWRRQ